MSRRPSCGVRSIRGGPNSKAPGGARSTRKCYTSGEICHADPPGIMEANHKSVLQLSRAVNSRPALTLCRLSISASQPRRFIVPRRPPYTYTSWTKSGWNTLNGRSSGRDSTRPNQSRRESPGSTGGLVLLPLRSTKMVVTAARSPPQLVVAQPQM